MGAASFAETFLVLGLFADFPLLVDGLWAAFGLALLARRAAVGAFLAGFFAPAVAFFLAAAFFADMALASKTFERSRRLYRRLGVAEEGCGQWIQGGKVTAGAASQPGLRCSATTVV